MYVRNTDKQTVFRLGVIRRLFNSRIREVGVMLHRCRGCCKGWSHTLCLMQTVGLKAIFRFVFTVYSRSTCTGCEKASQQIGLPAAIHGLLLAIVLRVLPNKTTVPPPVPPPGVPAVLDATDRGLASSRVDDPTSLAAERSDVSVFREDIDVRDASVRSWVIRGSLGDDMCIARKTFMEYEKVVLDQLKMSGIEWGKRQ